MVDEASRPVGLSFVAKFDIPKLATTALSVSDGYDSPHSMVRLRITPNTLEAIQYVGQDGRGARREKAPAAYSSKAPAIGDPISHTELLELSKRLRDLIEKHDHDGSKPIPVFHLDDLLRGSRVYVEPPPLRAEPVRL